MHIHTKLVKEGEKIKDFSLDKYKENPSLYNPYILGSFSFYAFERGLLKGINK